MNEWISFVLYAVLGKMREADAIMREHSLSVKTFAAYLARRHREKFPREAALLYRGVVSDDIPGELVLPGCEFVSFSEIRDVALWFASPGSSINEEMRKAKPNATGWVISMNPAVGVSPLFHWRWAEELPLIAWGVLHPHILPQVDQLSWNLSTQKEVILPPIVQSERWITAVNIHPATVLSFDARFTHPDFRR